MHPSFIYFPKTYCVLPGLSIYPPSLFLSGYVDKRLSSSQISSLPSLVNSRVTVSPPWFT